jgi:isopentenyl diphosphate isomerase/L-lactate dehydrogenase-like FMN-dependent dehydrogenase
MDFEPVARKNIPVGHWGYLAGGADDDGTVRANREGFAHYQLRPRRLVDVSTVDSSVTLMGKVWETPVVLNPLGTHKAFHPEGEVAVARAAKAKKHLVVLSTMATTSIEDVTAARGEPVWFQLYSRNDWGETRQMLKRAESAGAPVVVYTIDLLGGRNTETMARLMRQDTRQCTQCHTPAPMLDNRRKPMVADLTPSQPPIREVGTPTWDYVKRLKDATSMKVFLKGIVTREDADLAMQHGVDGVFVSNHGGRADETLRPAIDSLVEVAAGIRGRAPIVMDGGVRRGTDIFKAMALGATAVGIGRPYIWGLGAFGQEGVEMVLEILRREFQLTMRQAGTTTVKGITPSHVVRA